MALPGTRYAELSWVNYLGCQRPQPTKRISFTVNSELIVPKKPKPQICLWGVVSQRVWQSDGEVRDLACAVDSVEALHGA